MSNSIESKAFLYALLNFEKLWRILNAKADYNFRYGWLG
nr:MAG TPA_asm: Protein of unknown function (DUF809) [Caudoviricetes sp.]